MVNMSHESWGDNDLGDIFPFEEDIISECKTRTSLDENGFGSEIRDKIHYYDWITNHVFNDHPLCCRWGPRMNHMYGLYGLMHRLYLSFKANDLAGGTLVLADCFVFNDLVGDHCNAKFGEAEVSPFVKVRKTIQVPEEVKRIRELSQGNNIVATLTDSEVQLWNFNDLQTSDPYLVLREDENELGSNLLALSCIADRFVLSGGTSQNVLLWDIEANSVVAADTQNNSRPIITPHRIFRGHKGTVRDVQFHPSSSQVFCSVADDRRLLLWDARVGRAVAEVDTKHTDVIHSVDWNHLDPHYIITGSADKTVRLFDLRNVANSSVGSPPRTFQHHEAAVLCVQWCPVYRSMFASSSNDGIINVWDHKLGSEHTLFEKLGQVEHLFFQHVGHRGVGVVDFQWSKWNPMTIASVSDGFRQLQIWFLAHWYCCSSARKAKVKSDSDSNTEIPSWQWWPQSGDIQVEEQTHKVTDSDRVTDEAEQGQPRVALHKEYVSKFQQVGSVEGTTQR